MEEKRLNIPFETKRDTLVRPMEHGKKLIVKMNIPAENSENDEENTSTFCAEQDLDVEVSREALLQQIQIAQDELEKRKQHSKRVEELNRAVEEWKADFARALEKIQDTFAFVK